jgi:hypothetical protein
MILGFNNISTKNTIRHNTYLPADYKTIHSKFFVKKSNSLMEIETGQNYEYPTKYHLEQELATIGLLKC